MNRPIRKSWSIVMWAVLALIADNAAARKSDVSAPSIRYGRTPSGYLYMNGGASASEQFSMERAAAPFNVKLVMVPPVATPLPQFRVYIVDNGTGRIEKISLSGPWLYFKLPAGSYTIGVRIKNRRFLLREVRGENAGRQTHVLRAEWLPSAGNPPKNNAAR